MPEPTTEDATPVPFRRLRATPAQEPTEPASEGFSPVPFLIVDTPEQLKGFTDPLRNRVLSILADHEATNQQIARALHEPHAKVLHHVRYLLDIGLIRLVDTRIKGGNVEKYYRAEARLFGMRPGPELAPAVVSGEFEALTQEVAASVALWHERGEQPNWEGRKARFTKERLEEFNRRLLALVREFWGGPRSPTEMDASHLVEGDAGAPMYGFATVVYRDPVDPALHERS